jgi:hypothetical protein
LRHRCRTKLAISSSPQFFWAIPLTVSRHRLPSPWPSYRSRHPISLSCCRQSRHRKSSHCRHRFIRRYRSGFVRHVSCSLPQTTSSSRTSTIRSLSIGGQKPLQLQIEADIPARFRRLKRSKTVSREMSVARLARGDRCPRHRQTSDRRYPPRSPGWRRPRTLLGRTEHSTNSPLLCRCPARDRVERSEARPQVPAACRRNRRTLNQTRCGAIGLNSRGMASRLEVPQEPNHWSDPEPRACLALRRERQGHRVCWEEGRKLLPPAVHRLDPLVRLNPPLK